MLEVIENPALSHNDVDDEAVGHYYCSDCWPIAELATKMLCGYLDYSGNPEDLYPENPDCQYCLDVKVCPDCGYVFND